MFHTNIRVLVLIVALCLSGAAGGTRAAEPETAAFRFGDLAVTALRDYAITAKPTELLLGITPEEIARLAPGGEVELTTNAFLVRMNGKTLLFDTGCGAAMGGRMADSLKLAGATSDEVDAVILTHLHFDHVGGLVKDGQRAFPKAILFVDRTERNWWLDDDRFAQAEGQLKDWIAVARNALAPYDGRITLFDFGAEILPGVVTLDAHGHTAGHTIYRLAAGDGELLILGDLAHIAAVQLPRPQTGIVFDSDPEQAVKARLAVFSLAAEQKLPVAGMHLPFPGVGTLAKQGEGFAFTSATPIP